VAIASCTIRGGGGWCQKDQIRLGNAAWDEDEASALKAFAWRNSREKTWRDLEPKAEYQ
jgi:hypothetical protein